MMAVRRVGPGWLATAVLLGLLLAGCADPYRVRSSGVPPDPPPPAARKPDGLSGPAFALRGEVPDSHLVRPGETLYGIARRYNVPLRALIDRNNLEPPYTLFVNQRLTLPQEPVHVVARGDTVYSIARRYGVDMGELVRVNAITSADAIRVGERLIIPADGETRVAGRSDPSERIVSPGPPAPDGGSEAPAPRQPRDIDVASLPAEPRGATETTPETRPTAEPADDPTTRSAAIPQPPARAGGRFLWPVRGEVISGFGPQEDGRHNDGINIAADRGTTVRAAENGVIAYAGNELRGFGNLLLIKHQDGWITAYAHNDELLVGHGAVVERGQPIARVGSSGSVSTPQLHFEVRKGSRAIDPLQMLEQQRAAQ